MPGTIKRIGVDVGRMSVFFVVATALLASGVATFLSVPQPSLAVQRESEVPRALETEFAGLNAAVRALENRQAKLGRGVVDDRTLGREVSKIQLDIAVRHYGAARAEMAALRGRIAGWNAALGEAGGTAVAASPLFVPILLYHKPPADFERQMQVLKDRGYTSVDLTQLSDALAGTTPLPPKPVVITFDDGFSEQASAVPVLERLALKATFYVINGGERSHYCIGAGRRPGACGDAYFTWDEVRRLDQNPLFTVGFHTTDHLNLADQTPEVQRAEIIGGKAEIERQLGHPVLHFCYPYGAYNDTSVALVREAGFLTATTTLPGDYQAPDSRYTLKRIRTTLDLP